MESEKKMGGFEFLDKNKPIKFSLLILIITATLAIIFLVAEKGYSLETNWGSLKPPHSETREQQATKVKDSIFTDTKNKQVPDKPTIQYVNKYIPVKPSQQAKDSTKFEQKPTYTVTSNGQNGGITAGEVKIVSPSKKITLNEKNKIDLLKVLPTDKQEYIAISAASNNPISYDVAEQIIVLLKSNGYKNLSDIGQFSRAPVIKGIVYGYNKINMNNKFEILIGMLE